MTPIRIVVVDDHSLFRRGLIGLLGEMPDIEIVGEAANGLEALQAIRQCTPDLVLMDVNMPEMDGVEVVRALRTQKFSGRILMLTISQNEEDLLGALQAGADGYLLKNLEPEDLDQAIRQVRKGIGVLSPEVTDTVFRVTRYEPPQKGDSLLSPREQEVLERIAAGDTTSQAANALAISDATVKTHVKNIFKKLGVANRAEAIHRANQLGLLP